MVRQNNIKIKYVCDAVFSGGTPDTGNPYFWDGDIPWTASGAMQNSSVSECTKYITKSGMNSSSTKLVKKNTPLIAMTGATCANVGYSTFDSCYNQSVCSFITKKSVNSKFVYYALMAIREDILSNQFGGAQAGINVQTCKNLVIPILDYDKQEKVVEFLDNKIGMIDNTINNIKLQIEEAKLYRLNLITEVITGGLDDEKKVESGMPWCGKVPLHWKRIRVKDHTYLKGRIGWQNLRYEDFIESGPYCITGTDFLPNASINWETCYHVSEKRYSMDRAIQVQVGDLLITKDGTVGKLAFVDNLPYKACLNSHILIIRVNDYAYDIKFLFYVLKSRMLSNYLDIKKNGTVMDSLTQEMLENFSFYVPNIEEQRSLVSFLDNKCSIADKLIYSKQQKIDELNKYKKSLIYECVTGKMEV